MNDAMKTESLSVNREPLTEALTAGQGPAEIGAPPQAEHAGGQAGLPVLGSGAAARQRLERQGVEFVESEMKVGVSVY